MSYSKTVLPNGLRVVTERIENVRSVCLGVCIVQGARDETDSESGISHMIEHLIFKGTRKRTAKDIAIQVDSIGGELNGFTAHEFTYFYARCMDEHFEFVWDILSDIVKNAKFESDQIELERNVILEEIKSFNDSPSEQALHILSQLLFDSHPFARSIAGSEDNVKRFSQEDILKFRNSHYKAPGIIAVASGAIQHKNFAELVSKTLKFSKETLSARNNVLPKKLSSKIRQLEKKDISQIHLAMGTKSIEYKNKDRYAWSILTTIMGGGMSSRLFQRLREKEGLVYEALSFLELFSDTGIFGTYLVTDPKNVNKAIDCVWDEFDQLRKNGLEKKELIRTKGQLKGNLMLSLESTSSRVASLLTNEMHLGKYVSPEETIRNIDKVSADDVLSIADKYLIPEIYAISKVGPLNQK
ncbi:MAG: pitrilysin family protein [bacterium]